MFASVASAPSLRVMQATTSWSRRGSGTPTMRASFTGAQARSCTSSSAGDTLAPPVLIISVRRPSQCTKPSASTEPASPVWKKPSASKQSSGRLPR